MPRMKKKEMNEAERKYRLAQNYRHFAWRIMVYLKAHPDVLNTNNNQEVYDAVREIQIQYHLKHKIICQKNNISLSELARRIGQTPQNFNKKILRNTISDDELSKILLVLNIEYEQKIRFSDGTSIEMKTD